MRLARLTVLAFACVLIGGCASLSSGFNSGVGMPSSAAYRHGALGHRQLCSGSGGFFFQACALEVPSTWRRTAIPGIIRYKPE